MRIKVEVDLCDLYDEDGEGENFNEQIKTAIAWDVKQAVLKDWKAKITDEFKTYVVSEIEKSKTSFVDDTLKELAVNAKVKKRYSSNDMISIKDYITEELQRTQLSSDAVQNFLRKEIKAEENRLKELSKSFTDELKERYDLLFASQIVTKLNENGMLKDKVAKLILDK